MLGYDEIAYFVDRAVYKELLTSYKWVTKADQDRVFIIDGREGSGKSTLAMQLAYALDPTLNLEDVVFNSKDFEKKLRTYKRKSVIYDEAFIGLSSKNALSKENKYLISALQQCRQNNLFIFIVLPSIFLLEKYPGIFRSHALFHTINDKRNIKRKYYRIYGYEQKKLLYLLGKPLMSYNRPIITKTWRFYGKLPPTISKEAYQEKKRTAFQVSRKEMEAKVDINKHRFHEALYLLIKEKGMTQTDVSIHLNKMNLSFDRQRVSEALKEREQRHLTQ